MTDELIIIPRSRQVTALERETLWSYPSPLLVDRMKQLRKYYDSLVLVAGHRGETTIHKREDYTYYQIDTRGIKLRSKARYARFLFQAVREAQSPTILNFDPNLSGALFGFLGKIFGGQLVTKFIGLPEQDPGRFCKSRLGFTMLLAVSDTAITISPYCEHRLKRLYDREIEVVPNRVHPDFRPMDVTRIPNSILYVGRFDPEKRVSLLLKAFARLTEERDDAELILVGDSDEAYRSEARSLGIESATRFVGRVPRNEIPVWMNRATVFAYPTHEEAFGMALIEAMACGTPIVGADSGSIPWVVDEGGMIVDPTDTQEFADMLFRVLTDESLRTELAESALERAVDFPHDTWGENLFQAINK